MFKQTSLSLVDLLEAACVSSSTAAQLMSQFPCKVPFAVYLAKHKTHQSFLLIAGNLKDMILHQIHRFRHEQKRILTKLPVKKTIKDGHVTLLTLMYLLWAHNRCSSKKNDELISNRTSCLTSNNFRRTKKQFVQLHAMEITKFFYCLSDEMPDCHVALIFFLISMTGLT